MARVYISYSTKDAALASRLAQALLQKQHEVFLADTDLTAGVDWRKSLTENLGSSDAIVVLLTENSKSSSFVISEVGAARAFQLKDPSFAVLPVIFGSAKVPDFIADVQAIVCRDGDLDEAARLIDRALVGLLGRSIAEKKQRSEARKNVQVNAKTFIDEAMEELFSREVKARTGVHAWYVIGFLSLLSGVGVMVIGARFLLQAESQGWPLLSILLVKGIAIVLLLVACAKYAFMLGRELMSSAAKLADRKHAIAFGRFYLNAYPDKVTWEELKEAFQHWNIDRSGFLGTAEASQFDPRLVELFVSLVKAARANSSKDGEKSEV